MIGYYVHHQGHGHLHRALSIACHLDAPVTILSSLPRAASWSGPWVDLPRDDQPASDSDVTGYGRLHWVPRHHPGLRSRMALLSRWIDTHRPALLISDVSVEVTAFARLMGVPVIAVGMRGDRSDAAHQLGYDLADRLLLPWSSAFPEPQWPDRWRNKSVHVGAFSRFDGRPVPKREPGDRPTAVVLLGTGGSDIDPQAMDEAVRAVPDWRWTFLGADRWTADPWPVLSTADVVIGHCGNNIVAEIAAARRPAVLIAQTRPHGEQAATARALRRGRLAVVQQRWPASRDWPGLLSQAVALGGRRWREWAPGDGAERAARFIDFQARELTCAPR
ncbi:glycosyl transferase [Pseudonocardiaceae bacterium YIM PH 21723]|nr:glycosyl transferase [Pseudonocardiaceae bacterium YIM PH 21723]